MSDGRSAVSRMICISSMDNYEHIRRLRTKGILRGEIGSKSKKDSIAANSIRV
jgi:hypothetical protein